MEEDVGGLIIQKHLTNSGGARPPSVTTARQTEADSTTRVYYSTPLTSSVMLIRADCCTVSIMMWMLLVFGCRTLY